MTCTGHDRLSGHHAIQESLPSSPSASLLQVQSMDYSCIVFDTAPTGHTLRLLQFPTTLQKGLQKLMSLKGAFGGIMSQVAGLMGMGNASEVQDQLLGKLETLKVGTRKCQGRGSPGSSTLPDVSSEVTQLAPNHGWPHS